MVEEWIIERMSSSFHHKHLTLYSNCGIQISIKTNQPQATTFSGGGTPILEIFTVSATHTFYSFAYVSFRLCYRIDSCTINFILHPNRKVLSTISAFYLDINHLEFLISVPAAIHYGPTSRLHDYPRILLPKIKLIVSVLIPTPWGISYYNGCLHSSLMHQGICYHIGILHSHPLINRHQFHTDTSSSC